MKRTVDLIEDSSGTLSTSTGVEIAKVGINDSYTKLESDAKFTEKYKKVVVGDSTDAGSIELKSVQGATTLMDINFTSDSGGGLHTSASISKNFNDIFQLKLNDGIGQTLNTLNIKPDSISDKNGDLAHAGDSFTKAESDTRYQQVSNITKGASATSANIEVISSGTEMFKEFSQVVYDDMGFFTSDTEITIPASVGKVIISSRVMFSDEAVGTRFLTIRRTGSTTDLAMQEITKSIGESFGTPVAITSPVLIVSEGEKYRIGCYQNSGVDMNMLSGYNSWVSIVVVK